MFVRLALSAGAGAGAGGCGVRLLGCLAAVGWQLAWSLSSLSAFGPGSGDQHQVVGSVISIAVRLWPRLR